MELLTTDPSNVNHHNRKVLLSYHLTNFYFHSNSYSETFLKFIDEYTSHGELKHIEAVRNNVVNNPIAIVHFNSKSFGRLHTNISRHVFFTVYKSKYKSPLNSIVSI